MVWPRGVTGCDGPCRRRSSLGRRRTCRAPGRRGSRPCRAETGRSQRPGADQILGPPGTGKTHLATGLAIRACQAGHRVLFATASEWVARLAEAHHAGRLQTELTRLGRYPLLVIDEVGYIPFEPEAANLFFQLVSSRYERASLIVTSNKPFGKAHLFA
jgi:DNA replication protein DnaC